ncbi:hypothetical protein HZZ00_01330 [Streptomyces sp. NEAU-sy36]|uniref:hypothetical protein n=1 Tax=unclassified Streptomyces TaxID=2593676 RepID=UPI0015D5DA42|nr:MULTISPECIES: hypothetical protein [unclassified Streptomyces]QLI99755.1 hypothetical protein HZZ00_01330 [Streptomyces sp. NEAU-sy36]
MTDSRTPAALAPVGYAEIVTDAPERHSRNGSSLFADPLAWLMAEAAEAAARDCRTGLTEIGDLSEIGDLVGMIAISEVCTLDTMRLIARATPRGRLSPLKFAGANPGSLAGLACIRQGFRGPTLTLSMPPAAALRAALDVAAGWFGRGSARFVLLGTHRQDGDTHAVRCAVLQSVRAPEPHTESALARLAAPVPTTVAAAS